MMRTVCAVGFLLAWMVGAAAPTMAGDTKVKNIETLFAQKDKLSGQHIQISGKVVKVNNGIMGKNFFHLQDGSGNAPANDLTVTTQEMVKVGDQVTVTGLVTVNRDFGAGYSYPLILEEATVVPSGH
ncbi:MAG: OB-fold nucleic acid binding domain-containing protein [Nitrospirota bacterium]